MLGLPQLPRTLAAAERDAFHPRVHVRVSALADLVRLSRGAERAAAIRAIGRVLTDDPSAELRADAAMALADAEAFEGREALLSVLGDPHLRVRQMAVLALGEIAAARDEVVIAALEPLLGATEPALRFQALIALYRLSPESAAELLTRSAADDDGEVRAMVYRLADELWPPEVSVPDAFLERAKNALRDSTTAVRATAAVFLAGRGDPQAEAVLVSVIDGSVPAGTLADVQAAIELAAEREISAAAHGLARRAFASFVLRSDPLSWHAKIALARLGDARAESAILSGLVAWTRDARTLAVVAAGRARLTRAYDTIRRFRGDAERADPDAVEEALALLAGAGERAIESKRHE
jgi:hypothetical protein